MIVEIFFQVGNAMKILIRGGRLIDPANSIDSVHDLLLQDGRVAAIDPAEAAADVTIDAAGKVVCPGFIDIHMHEDPVLEDGTIDNDLETAIQNTMLRMGVTTAVAGNCGEVKYHPADYLDLVDKQGTAVNIAIMAGHEYFRVKSGCTDKYGPATEAQKAQMAAELEECLLRGCLGISYGIRYVPGLDRDELLQTAAGCRVTGGVLAAHIRDDAEAVFAAAEEFIDIGRTLSLPMEISHIGSMAGFGQMERFLRQVDRCKAEGLKIGCDCYPYDAFSTDLGSTTYDDGWRDRYGCGYDVVELCEGKYKGQRCTKEIFDEVRRDFPDCKTICYVAGRGGSGLPPSRRDAGQRRYAFVRSGSSPRRRRLPAADRPLCQKGRHLPLRGGEQNDRHAREPSGAFPQGTAERGRRCRCGHLRSRNHRRPCHLCGAAAGTEGHRLCYRERQNCCKGRQHRLPKRG